MVLSPISGLITLGICLYHIHSAYGFTQKSSHILAIPSRGRSQTSQMVLHHHPNDLQQLRQKLVVILGPTATGKTKASIEVALNLRQHGITAEIVNADSMQVGSWRFDNYM